MLFIWSNIWNKSTRIYTFSYLTITLFKMNNKCWLNIVTRELKGFKGKGVRTRLFLFHPFQNNLRSCILDNDRSLMTELFIYWRSREMRGTESWEAASNKKVWLIISTFLYCWGLKNLLRTKNLNSARPTQATI